MRELLLLLLVGALGISGTLHAQTTSSNEVTIEWGRKDYRIEYFKDGKPKVLQGQHQIPLLDAAVEYTGGRKATRSTDIVTPETLNYQLLDSMLWVACNEYRATKNLPPVAMAKRLHRMASHHSYYQQYHNILAHGETKPVPHRKADQENYRQVFGRAAEICLYNWNTLGEVTYREIAEDCIDQWANSPGHNAIMISKSYQFNGFGVCLEYASQRFASKELLEKYNPELLATIQRECPTALMISRDRNGVRVWATGNFTTGNADEVAYTTKTWAEYFEPEAEPSSVRAANTTTQRSTTTTTNNNTSNTVATASNTSNSTRSARAKSNQARRSSRPKSGKKIQRQKKRNKRAMRLRWKMSNLTFKRQQRKKRRR